MSARRSLVWLGLTPEPERELPAAVATLRPRAPGSSLPSVAAAERRRIERLILHGTEHRWLGYLAEVTDLVVDASRSPEAGGSAAALVAGEVVLDHHHMLIGLPGTGYERAAPQRRALEKAVRRLKDHPAEGGAT